MARRLFTKEQVPQFHVASDLLFHEGDMLAVSYTKTPEPENPGEPNVFADPESPQEEKEGEAFLGYLTHISSDGSLTIQFFSKFLPPHDDQYARSCSTWWEVSSTSTVKIRLATPKEQHSLKLLRGFWIALE